MKKIVFVTLFVIVFSTTYATAFDVSVGFGGDFGHVFMSIGNFPEPEQSVTKIMNMNRAGYCFYADLTYLILSVGRKFYYSDFISGVRGTQSFLNIGLMAKYPFFIRSNITLFPIIGFDCQIFTSGKFSQEGYVYSKIKRQDIYPLLGTNYHDRFVINFGPGGDFSITDLIYIRAIFNYGINLNTISQKTALAWARNEGYYDAFFLDHGPSLKLAVGYRF